MIMVTERTESSLINCIAKWWSTTILRNSSHGIKLKFREVERCCLKICHLKSHLNFNETCVIYTYIHIYIYIYLYIYTYTYTYIHIHKYIHTHTYIHAYMHTYIHTYMHTYIHTYIHTYPLKEIIK